MSREDGKGGEAVCCAEAKAELGIVHDESKVKTGHVDEDFY